MCTSWDINYNLCTLSQSARVLQFWVCTELEHDLLVSLPNKRHIGYISLSFFKSQLSLISVFHVLHVCVYPCAAASLLLFISCLALISPRSQPELTWLHGSPLPHTLSFLETKTLTHHFLYPSLNPPVNDFPTFICGEKI